MNLGLAGRVAVVVASSKGLGRAAALELVAEGVRVVICARGEDELESARAEIEAAGGDVRAVRVDTANADDLERLVATAESEFGPVDILVTNGGGPTPGTFDEVGEDDWEAAVEGTLNSVVRLSRRVLPGMRKRGWGRMVHITSIAVKQPVDGLILSNTVRAGVTGFARTLANEVAADGITVNCVMPGFTWTDRVDELADKQAEARDATREQMIEGWENSIPARRLGEPRELAALIAFLASDRAGYITAQSVPVDGGWIRGLL
ncbi:MAG: SDR family oxidoreductase [Acidobacteria bacterium]|nr:SDR family oxidoreductase [Acidobacteriota bacterium]